MLRSQIDLAKYLIIIIENAQINLEDFNRMILEKKSGESGSELYRKIHIRAYLKEIKDKV